MFALLLLHLGTFCSLVFCKIVVIRMDYGLGFSLFTVCFIFFVQFINSCPESS